MTYPLPVSRLFIQTVPPPTFLHTPCFTAFSTSGCIDSAGTEKVPTYKYPHNYPNHYVKQKYLPEELGDKHYYEYGENKTEQAAKRYWDAIKGEL